MKTSHATTLRLTQLALLLAVILVMAYTPLGYLPIGPLSLSLLTIPVAIGAMLLGPTAGALLGGAFGLTSFLNAIQGGSAMGAALVAVNPVFYFITAVVGRILCGLCCGLICAGCKKLTGKQTGAVWGAISAPLLNTVFFMGFLVLFFYGSDYVQSLAGKLGAANPLLFIVALVGVQGLVEVVVCTAVSVLVTLPLMKFLNKAK